MTALNERRPPKEPPSLARLVGRLAPLSPRDGFGGEVGIFARLDFIGRTANHFEGFFQIAQRPAIWAVVDRILDVRLRRVEAVGDWCACHQRSPLSEWLIGPLQYLMPVKLTRPGLLDKEETPGGVGWPE
jgi:hypothetical protein